MKRYMKTFLKSQDYITSIKKKPTSTIEYSSENDSFQIKQVPVEDNEPQETGAIAVEPTITTQSGTHSVCVGNMMKNKLDI